MHRFLGDDVFFCIFAHSMEYYCGIEIIEQLTLDCCKVMVASVKPLNTNEMVEAALRRLSPLRREKTLRYRYHKGRALSAGAGLLLDYMLREHGLSERDMEFAEGEHGKPSLKGYPDLHFNLSHSDTLVACALGTCPVGIDVQHIVTLRDGLVKYTMNSEEIATLNAMETIDDKQLFFTQLWTLKESYVKATGRGLTHEFPAFKISNNEVTALSQLNPPATFKLINLDDAVVSVAIINQ